MSKYSPAQLKVMACQFVTAHVAGDDRAFQLIITVSMITGIRADDVVKRIEELANA